MTNLVCFFNVQLNYKWIHRIESSRHLGCAPQSFFVVDRATGAVSVSRALSRAEAAVVRLTVRVTDVSAATLQEGTGELISCFFVISKYISMFFILYVLEALNIIITISSISKQIVILLQKPLRNTATSLKSGFPSGTLVVTIVGVNDRAPLFASPWTPESPRLRVQLPEEAPAGTLVGTFEATDPDSASVARYELDPPSEFFTIDNETGENQFGVQLHFRNHFLNFQL